MELSPALLFNKIMTLEEKQPQKVSDYKQIIGIISGNKHFIKESSMEDIAYLIENITDIMRAESSESYPSIELKKCRTLGYARRVI